MNQEEIELLKQTLAEQKKTNKTLTILLGIVCIALVAIIVCGVILLPKILSLISALHTTMDDLQPAISGINNFDYDSLNASVSQLKDAITSLNNFLSVFH